MAEVKLIEVYADTIGFATCKGSDCGQRIMWAEVVKTGKKMCFSGEPVVLRTRHEETRKNGFVTRRTIQAFDFAENHWASCANSQGFKSSTGTPPAWRGGDPKRQHQDEPDTRLPSERKTQRGWEP